MIRETATATIADAPSEIERLLPPPADLVLDLGQPIASVVGVWLRRDTRRAGRNYLGSFYESFVALNGLPTEELRVAFYPRPAISLTPAPASFMERFVKVGETVQGLAEQFLGAWERWPEIVSLNGLDSPYIADDPSFPLVVPASNAVIVTRKPGTTGRIVVPRGQLFFAPKTDTEEVILHYAAARSTVLAEDQASVAVDVSFFGVGNDSGELVYLSEAAIVGLTGNIGPHRITQVGGVANGYGWGLGPWGQQPWGGGKFLASLVTVDHAVSFTNGRIRKVLVPGDTIQLPIAPTPNNVVSEQVQQARLFGIDVRLQDGELLADTAGDLQTVAGAPNLRQALENRLDSFHGELALHRDYGSEHLLFVGQEGTDEKLDLVRMEVALAVRRDPRINRTQNVRVHGDNDFFVVDFDAVAIGESNATPLNLVVNRGR